MAKENNDDLYDMISATMASVKKHFPSVRKSINEIIHSKTISGPLIEKVLDDLLGYVPHGFGEKEFKRLNRYYAKINPEAADLYERYFKEALERR